MTEVLSYFESTSPAPELLAGDVDVLGFNLLKAVKGTVSSAAKLVTAPQRAVVKTVANVAKGQNVAKSVAQGALSVVASNVKGAKVMSNAATFLPGLGTGVAFAIQFTASVGPALLAGKNVLAAAKGAAINAALNSLPGGTVTGSLIKAVANVIAKGASGQNVLKSAANELAGVAIAQIPNAQAQQVLITAVDSALKGQNVMTGAKVAVVNAALKAIPDAGARAVVSALVNRKPIADAVKLASPALLGKVAGAMPTGGTAVLVTSIVGKTPAQLVAAKAPAVAKVVVAAVKQANPAAIPKIVATAKAITAAKAKVAAQTYAKAAVASPLIKVTTPAKPSGITAPARPVAAKPVMSLAIPRSGITSTAAMGLVQGVTAGLRSTDASKRKTAQDMVAETAKRAKAKDSDALRAVALLKYTDKVA